ncbi:metallo-beta-lactamase superfamily protein [Clostridium sp. CAG:594]|nr:metallo-beta-lactamase superfamily protein [Clostridium sp. CAG:594]
MNDKKLNKLIRIIIGLVILIVVIIQGNLFDNVSNATASINDSTKSDKIDAKLKENFSVSFIDVGQADSVLIRNGNYNMLIDAGNNEDGEKLVNYFKSLGIEEFTYVFATHPHEDHIGGMDDIINNFKIDNYYMSNKLSTTKTFMDVLDALDGRNLKYTFPNKGDTLKLGDANIKVIYPGDDKSNINDSSIVLKITYGKNSFLLTGDATSNVERKIYNEDIKSDVLKVAHHGSSYSSTDVFLDRVKPYYAVISVGKNNIYNHPSNKTLEKLNKRNIKVYRTDLDGTIVFISDGDNLSVKALKTDTNG